MPSPSPTAKRLQDLHLIRRTQWRIQAPNLLSVYKNPDMRADGVLLIDHPEANPWIALIEIVK
jgi:hypothetical protein